MPSPELEEVLTLIAERAASVQITELTDMRALAESYAFPPTDAATITPVNAGGVPGEWVTVAESDPKRRLLYVHGGGYILGSPLIYRRLCEGIAQSGRCAVLNLDYRLAPEHPFPAAVEDALAGFMFVQVNGPDGTTAADDVFIAGDSAGGGLTLATLLAARERGLPTPTGAIAISAWTDLAQTGDSIRTHAKSDPLLTDAAVLDGAAMAYLGGESPEHPWASPLHGDLAGLPPLLLQVGDREILLDDTRRFAAKAREAGVEVTEEVWDDMFHVWHDFAPILPEAREAVERIGAWIRERC